MTLTFIILFIGGVAVLLGAVLIADALDERVARDEEAERYARLIRAKHDASNDILRQAGQCIEMSSLVATQMRQATPTRPSRSDPTVIDAEYSVQQNGSGN